MNENRVRRHVKRVGRDERKDHLHGGTIKYVVYECRHCSETFRHEEDSIYGRNSMFDNVEKHVVEVHNEEWERSTYPNESTFRGWAEQHGFNIIEPHEPGDPLVISFGDGREIRLQSIGDITLHKFTSLGGSSDSHIVEQQGGRLVVELPTRTKYISPRAFPL